MNGYIRNNPRVGDTYEGDHGVTIMVDQIIGDRVLYVMRAEGQHSITVWPEAIKDTRLIRTADGPVTDESEVVR